MTDIRHDPQHWQQRAEEMRAATSQITDVETVQAMLKIAGDYDALAERAFTRLQKDAAKAT